MCEKGLESNELLSHYQIKQKFKLSPIKSNQNSPKIPYLEPDRKSIIQFNQKSDFRVKYLDSPVKLVNKNLQKSMFIKDVLNLPLIPIQQQEKNIDIQIENQEKISNSNDLATAKYKRIRQTSITVKKSKIVFDNQLNSNFELPKQNIIKRLPKHSHTFKSNERNQLSRFRIINTEDNEIPKRNNFSSVTFNNGLFIEEDSDSENKEFDQKALFRNFKYDENINSEYKVKMEDFHRVVIKSNEALFCLFDGHGGDTVAKYVRDRIPEVFFAYLSKYDNDYLKAFNEVFRKIDEEMIFNKAQIMGTTATLVLITWKDKKKIIYSANVGDSRGLLVSNNDFMRISYDHKCDDTLESERIKQTGGSIINGRINGVINLSRSLGDLSMKKCGLISSPYIFERELNKEDKFIVIASDGVWDVTNDSDVFELSKECSSNEEFCKELVERSLNNGSTDNISCLSIEL